MCNCEDYPCCGHDMWTIVSNMGWSVEIDNEGQYVIYTDVYNSEHDGSDDNE